MGRYSIPLPSGKMRHSVMLQRLTEVSNAYGQLDKDWADVESHRCAIEQQKGSVVVNADQERAQRGGLITMRWFPGLDQRIHRFKFGTRIFNVVEIEDVDERHSLYKIVYQETVGAI